MTHQRDPKDPREWMRRAWSNLTRARHHPGDPEVLYEDLCFDAQQAAEKAIKAVLVSRQIEFPKTHSIAQLITLAREQAICLPDDLEDATTLTPYAVATRYPRVDDDVTTEEHLEAVVLAEKVVKWAEKTLRGGTPTG